MSLFTRIIEEYSRAHEDAVNDQILVSDAAKSTVISKMIDETYMKGHQVWIMTDWHLLKYNKETKAVTPNPHINAILTSTNDMIKPEDLLIYLGDICDGEVEDKARIERYLDGIPGRKILVRGNNDLFPDLWYLQHGFKIVTPKFIWNNILFSHRPQDNANKINVHGHIHGSCKYYNSEISHFNNQIDVAWVNGRIVPTPLSVVLSKQPAYAKVITFVDKPWKNDKPITAVK